MITQRNMDENLSLTSLHSANQITRRLLTNAINQKTGDFSGLEESEFINPSLLMPKTENDKIIKLWGITPHEYKKDNKTTYPEYASVRIAEFTFIERPIDNTTLIETVNKFGKRFSYVKEYIERGDDDGGKWQNEFGVVIMPISLMRIQEFKIHKTLLSQENLAVIAADIEESEGAKFVGFLEEGGNEDHAIIKKYYNDLDYAEILHPIKPEFAGDKRVEEWSFDKITGNRLWVLRLFYEPFFPCQRINCPFENETLSKDLNDMLRRKTIEYIKRLRVLAQISFKNTMLMFMESMLPPYGDSTTETLSAAAKSEQLEELQKILDDEFSASS